MPPSELFADRPQPNHTEWDLGKRVISLEKSGWHYRRKKKEGNACQRDNSKHGPFQPPTSSHLLPVSATLSSLPSPSRNCKFPTANITKRHSDTDNLPKDADHEFRRMMGEDCWYQMQHLVKLSIKEKKSGMILEKKQWREGLFEHCNLMSSNIFVNIDL